jgi:hypothetical protein
MIPTWAQLLYRLQYTTKLSVSTYIVPRVIGQGERSNFLPHSLDVLDRRNRQLDRHGGARYHYQRWEWTGENGTNVEVHEG